MHTIRSVQQTAAHHVTYKYTNGVASDERQADGVIRMKLLPGDEPWRVVCSRCVLM